MHIEKDEIDPTETEYTVECSNLGVYNIPTLAGESWPNCTETVKCGQPPAKPSNLSINGVFGYEGSIEWLSPAADLQDTYR